MISQDSFPKTARQIHRRRSIQNGVVYGGAARGALLEAARGTELLVRDVDEVGPTEVGDPSVFFQKIGDFGLNKVMALNDEKGRLELYPTDEALDAVGNKILRPTEHRTCLAEQLRDAHETDPSDVPAFKHYHRTRTDIITRAIYIAAVISAAGEEFTVDMANYPTPQTLAEVHKFFLGLRVRKSLAVDERSRGSYDITATRRMLGGFAAFGLIATPPKGIDSIVHFCEEINEEHPQLRFHGSKVAQLVRHTDKQPYAKVE